MNIYTKKIIWKYVLLLFAISIGTSSLWYTNNLVQQLVKEESKKIKLWAEATNLIINYDLSNESLDFLLKVIKFNETVPVIVVDNKENILMYRNIDSLKAQKDSFLIKKLNFIKSNTEKNRIYTIRQQNKLTFYIYSSGQESDYEEQVLEKIEKIKKRYEFFGGKKIVSSETYHFPNPLTVSLPGGKMQYVYYDRSTILKQLTYYPYVQLGIIIIFIFFAYFAFSSSRKAEQNQVWVGLSKETAHQLGTPISSLLAWHEIIQLKIKDKSLLSEFEKDVLRLQIITERFSKIGSKPKLKNENIKEVLLNAVNYIKSRASNKSEFIFSMPDNEIMIPINKSLFEWVVENICKNAIDAINGSGIIEIILIENPKNIQIDIKDNGKGIPKRKYKTIFKPGFTTKERGWGLGLSLTKRIIEDYHDGNIFVYNSAVGKGTTIRLILKK